MSNDPFANFQFPSRYAVGTIRAMHSAAVALGLAKPRDENVASPTPSLLEDGEKLREQCAVPEQELVLTDLGREIAFARAVRTS